MYKQAKQTTPKGQCAPTPACSLRQRYLLALPKGASDKPRNIPKVK